MNKLLIVAAAVTLMAAPGFVGPSSAAPVKSPFCNMVRAQRNPVSWNAYYHCWGVPPKAAVAHARASKAPARSPYCNMAKGQKNPVAWNAYYHCVSR